MPTLIPSERGGITAVRKKTVTADQLQRTESLRPTWLTAADVKSSLSERRKICTKAEHLTCAVGGNRPV